MGRKLSLYSHGWTTVREETSRFFRTSVLLTSDRSYLSASSEFVQELSRCRLHVSYSEAKAEGLGLDAFDHDL